MPDLLDMLNMCVGQGLTVPDSCNALVAIFAPCIPHVARTEHRQRASQDQHLANGSRNFSRRIDLPEVHSLTSLLIQTNVWNEYLAGTHHLQRYDARKPATAGR